MQILTLTLSIIFNVLTYYVYFCLPCTRFNGIRTRNLYILSDFIFADALTVFSPVCFLFGREVLCSAVYLSNSILLDVIAVHDLMFCRCRVL